LSRSGADVVLARTESALSELASEIGAVGGRALVVSTDVREPELVHELVEQTSEAFGRLDAAVNNAGCRPAADTAGHESAGV
jgi:NADP-dependent 3-hydroxy acid dehydrogenase YdfG